MCGRYYADREFIPKLSVLFGESGVAVREDAESCMNTPGGRAGSVNDVVPTDMAFTVYAVNGELVCSRMIWGMKDEYHNRLVINARAETAAEKKMFSEGLKKRRCLLPASGFYEWSPAGAKYRFTLPEKELILLAGIYTEENDARRFTILTTEPNRSVADVHNRMPVMILAREMREWLTNDSKTPVFLAREQYELRKENDSGQIEMDLGL